MIKVIDREEVARRLTHDACIPIVRDAMIALSRGETQQLLRGIISLSGGNKFGVMPGAMGKDRAFGAKVVTLFPDNCALGLQSHQGLVVLFDPANGAPVCVLHAGEITAIRTAAASAVATDALARRDARRLAILGYGEQAHTHAMAISKVRSLEAITVWGRHFDKAYAFAAELSKKLGIQVIPAATAEKAVASADIICTVTAASEPILMSNWVAPGTHINVVGSGDSGPTEIENALVARSRFVADYRTGILEQGSEFLYAKAAGLVDDDHIVGEIGQVLLGEVVGRQNDDQVTIYKSIGHIVQDLATGWALFDNGTQYGIRP